MLLYEESTYNKKKSLFERRSQICTSTATFLLIHTRKRLYFRISGKTMRISWNMRNNSWKRTKVLSIRLKPMTDGWKDAFEELPPPSQWPWTSVLPDKRKATQLLVSQGRVVRAPFIRSHMGAKGRWINLYYGNECID